MGSIVKLGPNPDMTGATESSAGAHGLVPAPQAGDQNKFLKGDGSWDDSPEAEYNLLLNRLRSGAEEDAELHLGFYRDKNGDICEVDEEEEEE